MLALQKFDSKDFSIKDVIAKEFEDCGFPKTTTFTELFLQNGKLLVLLDGLDEVPAETLNHVITEIENLVDLYDNNRFIASCRVAAYTFGGFKRFNDVAMASFEDKQIERFIRNWFQKPRDLETETSQRCWELLNSPDYQAAKELAQPPLLLTLLCVIYDEFQDFPKKRHQVYGEALDVLLRKWASEKRLQKEPIYQQFGSDLELELLSEIAYTSFVDDQLFFSKQILLDQIQDFQTGNKNAPDLDAGVILQEVQVQQGILVEQSRNAYSFSHLTFQEYLTAKFIVDNQKTVQVVRDHLIDERWREVFLLIAGLVPGKRGVDELLIVMEEISKSVLMSDGVQDLVQWVHSEANKATESTSIAQKVYLFTNALERCIGLDAAFDHAIDQALEYVCYSHLGFEVSDLEELELALDSALKRAGKKELILTRILGHKRNSNLGISLELDFASIYQYINSGLIERGQSRAFVQELKILKSSQASYRTASKIWCELMNLDLNFLYLSDEDIQSLNDYFYTLELMIYCKDSATRISSAVWEGVEARILQITT